MLVTSYMMMSCVFIECLNTVSFTCLGNRKSRDFWKWEVLMMVGAYYVILSHVSGNSISIEKSLWKENFGSGKR